MTDPRNLARHLRQCHGEGNAPRTEAADAKRWFLALEELTQRGALEEAAYASRHLAAAFPNSAFIKRLAMLLDRMPPAADDPTFAAFANRSEPEIQVVRRTGATAVLMAFCGRHGSLGFPLPIAHRWFGVLGVHVVYLRDPYGGSYVAGLPSLSGDRASTVRALKTIVDELGAIRTVCYGNSSGGFAALLYGLEMQAAAVLVVNAVTVHSAEWVDLRVDARGRRHRADLPDIPRLYASAAVKPRTHLVYGAGNADDAASAAAMAGVPGVIIEAVPESDGHDVHLALIERGRFGSLLRDLVAGFPDPNGNAAGR